MKLASAGRPKRGMLVARAESAYPAMDNLRCYS